MGVGRWLVLACALVACRFSDRDRPQEEVAPIYRPSPSFATVDNPFEPLPQNMAGGPATELGRKLYADTIMSVDGSLTCFSCHDMRKGGTDGLPKASVASRQNGQINTGTIFNLAFNFRFNWNGQFVTLLDHVNGPLTGKNIMGMSWSELLRRVKSSDEYQRLFAKVYPDGVTIENIRHAVTAFQLSLVTPNAPFDRYLRGQTQALDAQQHEGYHLFKSLGCVSCHQGINVGGNLFAKIGVMGEYFADRQREGRGPLTEADYGRFLVTHNLLHRYVFRVPSLRNVACTAPYFHDGSLESLEEVVVAMGRYQLGRELNDAEVLALVAFLRSLTGEHEGRPLCSPDEQGHS